MLDRAMLEQIQWSKKFTACSSSKKWSQIMSILSLKKQKKQSDQKHLNDFQSSDLLMCILSAVVVF